jgi:hypothetical protein
MSDPYRVLAVLSEGPYIEIDFMDMSYEGPRALTVRLTSDDAVFLLDALAAEFGEIPVPEGSIVFERDKPAHLRLVTDRDLEHLREQVPPPADYDLPKCDGYCADCNHTCPNRAWPLNTEDPKDNSARWCLWASEPLPLGHSHPHQVEGS